MIENNQNDRNIDVNLKGKQIYLQSDEGKKWHKVTIYREARLYSTLLFRIMADKGSYKSKNGQCISLHFPLLANNYDYFAFRTRSNQKAL